MLVVLGGCGVESTAEGAEPVAVVGSEAPVAAVPTPSVTKVPVRTPVTASTKPGPASKSATVTPRAVKKTVKSTVVEYATIAFKKKTVTDDQLAKGMKVVTTEGANGTRRLTYEVTYVGSVQTAKKLVKQEVSKQPRTQVTTVGTKTEEESGCDPNYSGGCVPVASDVDCAGGSGNGPEYVSGPVTVAGNDIYRLDSDNDGLGCED
ncbi:G5 domain-containing protein [Kribbella sp. CA-247076]|uniref:G5 domain-containing protein n=1 Tax=Kribbella sp. CA-247076 TaxID=3239941 RepID=UPI003D8F2306